MAWNLAVLNEHSSKCFKHAKLFTDDYVLLLGINTNGWKESGFQQIKQNSIWDMACTWHIVAKSGLTAHTQKTVLTKTSKQMMFNTSGSSDVQLKVHKGAVPLPFLPFSPHISPQNNPQEDEIIFASHLPSIRHGLRTQWADFKPEY